LEKRNRNLKKWPRPYEAYNFWHHFFNNFNFETETAKNNMLIESCIGTINSICFWDGAPRFFTKVTGFYMWKTFNLIFEDPKIIWIERDPRAVVLSMMQNKWFYKNKTEKFDRMKFSEKAAFYSEQYRKIRKSRLEYPQENTLEIRYKDLLGNKELKIKEITKFTRLRLNKKCNEQINSCPEITVISETYRKKKDSHKWEQLTLLLKRELLNLGYDL
jgi:hypothetical protein